MNTIFSRNNPRPAVWLAAILVLLCTILVCLEPPTNTQFWSSFFNAGHAPLFGVISIILLQLWTGIAGRFERLYRYRYFLAGATALSLGVGTEILQGLVGRDAEFGDALRDAAGTVSFLLIAASYNRAISMHRAVRWASRLAAVVIFLLTCVSLGRWTYYYLHRNASFPTLASFDSPASCAFFSTEAALLSRCGPPKEWKDTPLPRVGLIRFCPAQYATVILDEPYPDWDGYGTLAMSLFSPEPDTFRLVVCVEDTEHNGDFSDRYNGRFTISPGANRVEVPLEEIASAPATRRTDLAHIHSLYFFVANPRDTIHLYLDSILLERP